jgi:hypothetical protein
MKVRILKEVPVNIDNQVVRLKPGTEIDALSSGVVASLLRGGDAEEVVEAPAVTVTVAGEPQKVSLQKLVGKKNRGAAPENK